MNILDWPRVRELAATAGAVLDVVRHNEKGRCQNSTMLMAIDPCHAVNLGVHFYQSQNQVILTPDDIPPEAILKTQRKYDHGGTPL